MCVREGLCPFFFCPSGFCPGVFCPGGGGGWGGCPTSVVQHDEEHITTYLGYGYVLYHNPAQASIHDVHNI